MTAHTINDLHMMQSEPTYIKVRMTQNRIREWVYHYGIDNVYVSFSGGKDSTVLLHIARELFPDIKAVFFNTGLEYPEIVKFVKTFDNVDIIRPKKSFKQVIDQYGYPFISKEVSNKVYGARKYLKKLKDVNRDEIPVPIRYKQVTGQVARNRYDVSKYKFFLEAPFDISDACCRIMKKNPAHNYTRITGRMPITAQMASESSLRTQRWLMTGCNGFNMASPVSNPMSFWTEQDVLKYIKDNDIRICSVYGKIIEIDSKTVPVSDVDIQELFDRHDTMLATTGCERTGCMFCGYGCHLEKTGQGRFLRLKESHPKVYNYIMSPDGLNYKAVIDWINEHGNFHIEY